MQLRDEIPTIVAPGCWGLFGGHLDPGETPEQALRRELVMVHHIHRRTAHVYGGELSMPLEQLQLLEQQARRPSPPGRWIAGGDAAWTPRRGLTTTKPGALDLP